jgi:hypothetical protein
MRRRTVVHVEGDAFFINGRPTYPGRVFRGMRVEGLLMNSRMVEGVFDDLNARTRALWDYPDGPWDPRRNTDEFVAAMADWRACGLLAFTINFQGGNPRGYGAEQPWHNPAYHGDGAIRRDYLARMRQVLDRADALGMAVILGLFYFGQDHRLADEAAVVRAADAVVDWLCRQRYTHVVVEICNEAGDRAYHHAILGDSRCDELIRRVQDRSAGRVDNPHKRLLASASLSGGVVPPPNVVGAADFLLLHGNGVDEPDGLRRLIDAARGVDGFRGQPVVVNEDDHFDFHRPDNNLLAAVGRRAGWGLFDYRFPGEGFEEGFQCLPANWRISSARKRGFFGLLAEITGCAPPGRKGG